MSEFLSFLRLKHYNVWIDHIKKNVFMAVLGLRCCEGVFLAVASEGRSRVAAHGLLTAVASLVAEHGL